MQSHLQRLVDYFSTHPGLALVLVFAGATLEALGVVGSVIPGSTAVFIGGTLIGLGVLNPWRTAAAAIEGAILGDGLSFWLGRRFGERIRSVWPMRKHPEMFERGRAYFEKRGASSTFIGRFLGPLRAIVPLVAGMSNMPSLKFYAVNIVSAFARGLCLLAPRGCVRRITAVGGSGQFAPGRPAGLGGVRLLASVQALGCRQTLLHRPSGRDARQGGRSGTSFIATASDSLFLLRDDPGHEAGNHHDEQDQ